MAQISIISICYNNLEELKATIKSIDIQSVLPNEHIIIDGSGNNEIRSFLESNSLPSWRKWVSEPDKGISDAFNKGILKSSSQITHLLNAGDTYFDDEVLMKVSAAFDKDVGLQWLHGKYVQFRSGISAISGKPFDRNLLYRGMRQVGHPTMFIKKELYEKHGLYDLNKKIAMDYDFLLRIRNEKFLFLEEVLEKFAPEGVSEKNVNAGLREVEESFQKYIGASMKQKLWFTRIKTLNGLMRTGLGRTLFRLKNKS